MRRQPAANVTQAIRTILVARHFFAVDPCVNRLPGNSEQTCNLDLIESFGFELFVEFQIISLTPPSNGLDDEDRAVAFDRKPPFDPFLERALVDPKKSENLVFTRSLILDVVRYHFSFHVQPLYRRPKKFKSTLRNGCFDPLFDMGQEGPAPVRVAT